MVSEVLYTGQKEKEKRRGIRTSYALNPYTCSFASGFALIVCWVYPWLASSVPMTVDDCSR
jgi:hypothetical protein